MPWGRWEDTVEQGLDTIREAEAFYELGIDDPDYRRTTQHPMRRKRLRPSWYDPAEHTVYLNPLLPGYCEHESRHAAHHRVVADVVERNMDAVRTYYEEELADLSSVPSGTGILFAARKLHQLFGIETATDRFYDTARTEELDVDELALQVRGKNRLTNPVQEEFYAENATGSEQSLNAVVAPVGAVVSGAGTAELYNAGIDTLIQEPQMAVPPFAILASYRAMQHLSQSHDSEPLIDENLEPYDATDRQRAMLYNSQVSDSIDNFLTVLDDYGIQ